MAVNVMGMLNVSNNIKNGKYDIEYIEISKIKESDKNFYNTDEFNELKLSIEISGLRQNIEVEEIANNFKKIKFKFIERKSCNFDQHVTNWSKNYLLSLNPQFISIQQTKWCVGYKKINSVTSGDGTGIFKIISGHRRYKACKELYDAGNEEFKLIPCRVVENISAIDSEIQLISGNAFNRELTDFERMHQVVRLAELLELQKAKGEGVSGGKREAIAELLNLSRTKVGDLQKIYKDLTVELKEEFKNENIDFTTARALAGQDKNYQDEKLDELKQGKKVTKTSIDKEIKENKEKEIKVVVDDVEIIENQLSFDDTVNESVIKKDYVEPTIELYVEGENDEVETIVPIMGTNNDSTNPNSNNRLNSSDSENNNIELESIQNKNVPIMGTNETTISEGEILEKLIKKHSGKLSVLDFNIQKYESIGRTPSRLDLEEQSELQVLIKALEFYKANYN